MSNESNKASVDDFFISRTDDGVLEPVEIQSPLFGKTVLIKPMTYGYVKKNGVNMQISAVDWPDAEKLQACKDHIKSPDLSDLTIEDVYEKMSPLTLDHLVSLVVATSVPTFARQRQSIETLTSTIKNVLSKSDLEKRNTSSTSSDTPTPVKDHSTD